MTKAGIETSSAPPGPGPAEWLDFRRRLEAVMAWPLVADDPECQAILRRLGSGTDAETFAGLMQRLADRGIELALARHGHAPLGIARRGPDRRPPSDRDEDGPPPRLMLRL